MAATKHLAQLIESYRTAAADNRDRATRYRDNYREYGLLEDARLEEYHTGKAAAYSMAADEIERLLNA